MLCSSITGRITEEVVSRRQRWIKYLSVMITELQCELGRKQFLKAVKLTLTAGISARAAVNCMQFIRELK